MNAFSQLACPGCGRKRGLEHAAPACDCGSLLEVEHSASVPPRSVLDARSGSRPAIGAGSGVWRFAELVLPVLEPEERVSLGEGLTPLLTSTQLGEWSGARELLIKHEGFNPTGSFKDRGMTVAVSWARKRGSRRVACASTGNTAASLAAYAAAAGLEAVVLAPSAHTARGKLAQALAHGARVLLLEGDFDDGLELVRQQAVELDLYLVNSINPLRTEGQKTIVFEALQQLSWEPPEWLAFPAGNLGNCAAFGKALRELRGLGWIKRAPRLLAVQAAGASPFVASYRSGFRSLEPVRAETIASAIRIGAPASWRRAARAIEETDGIVTQVSDAEIMEAKRSVDAAGVGAEPASCAALAGVRRLVREGEIRPDERVVCLLTGHLLKDVESVLTGVSAPATVRPGPGALAAALGGSP